MNPAFSNLPQVTIDTIEGSVRPKFNAYFEFTRCLVRQIHDEANGWFTYPNDSVLSDLMVLSTLFGELRQALIDGNAVRQFAETVSNHSELRQDFYEIVKGGPDAGGSFWVTENGHFTKISADDAVTPDYLIKLIKTLRNGLAGHFRWRYDDLSAQEYWDSQNWLTTGAPSAFDLGGRAKANYMAYVVDTDHWAANQFWQMSDLRIIATPYAVLRYHLHMNLQRVLNGSRDNIFKR
jgi:hypothetical protein